MPQALSAIQATTAAPPTTSVQFHDQVSTAVIQRKTYFLSGAKQTGHLLTSA
jgi:hypothetical protein